MKIKITATTLASLCGNTLFFSAFPATFTATEAAPYNVVFFVVDDMGWMDGESLVPVFQNSQIVRDRVVFTSTGPDTWSASSNRWRYIRNGGNYGDELYDIQNDPHEWVNLLFHQSSASRHTPIVNELSRNYPQNPVPMAEPFRKLQKEKALNG